MPESDLELKSLVQELSGVKPFSLLSNDQLLLWLKRSKIISFEIGARFLRPDQLSDSVFWIRSGRVRCLGIDPLGAGQVTISTAAEERLHGWLSLLRAQPSEFVQCSTNVELVALPADTFIEFILSTQSLLNISLISPQFSKFMEFVRPFFRILPTEMLSKINIS